MIDFDSLMGNEETLGFGYYKPKDRTQYYRASSIRQIEAQIKCLENDEPKSRGWYEKQEDGSYIFCIKAANRRIKKRMSKAMNKIDLMQKYLLAISAIKSGEWDEILKDHFMMTSSLLKNKS